jgi:hypothetical protein
MDAARYRLPFAMQSNGTPADSEGYVGYWRLYLRQIKERVGASRCAASTLKSCMAAASLASHATLDVGDVDDAVRGGVWHDADVTGRARSASALWTDAPWSVRRRFRCPDG